MQDYLIKHIRQSILKINSDIQIPDIAIEKPRMPEHGDAATNIALRLGGILKQKPAEIAKKIVSGIDDPSGYLNAIEVAGPGFINFRFDRNWLFDQLSNACEKGSDFGKSDIYKGQKVQVEFVSANPTGPLTVGHGRNAVLGDTIARVFKWAGANVEREYYFNNAGRQMRVLAESVRARYFQLIGKDTTFPEGGYEGDYISDIARSIREKHGDKLVSHDDLAVFKSTAETEIFKDIQRTLNRMNIKMDTFFNENELYEGAIEQVMALLEKKDLVYDHEGATWLKTTHFGKDKDTVLIKSSGEPTYRLPDIAYHIDKLNRSFDLVIDVFGADHIATYPDVIAAVNACGYDASKIDVVVYQFVTIVKDGKPFKMSTRKANFITLDELMDEVGSDVTRFFFLMRAPGTHLEFDIEEAKQSGEKNPVFYLQYAHARIKSIIRKAEETQDYEHGLSGHLSLLNHESEMALVKRVLEFPGVIEQTAEHKEPHRIINYLNELATAFHKFYHDCRILGEEKNLAQARISLLNITAHTLANGLSVLGISAPDRM